VCAGCRFSRGPGCRALPRTRGAGCPPFMSYGSPRSVGRPDGGQRWLEGRSFRPECPGSCSGGDARRRSGTPRRRFLPDRSRPRTRGFAYVLVGPRSLSSPDLETVPGHFVRWSGGHPHWWPRGSPTLARFLAPPGADMEQRYRASTTACGRASAPVALPTACGLPVGYPCASRRRSSIGRAAVL
jgi:hypothetical protein